MSFMTSQKHSKCCSISRPPRAMKPFSVSPSPSKAPPGWWSSSRIVMFSAGILASRMRKTAAVSAAIPEPTRYALRSAMSSGGTGWFMV